MTFGFKNTGKLHGVKSDKHTGCANTDVSFLHKNHFPEDSVSEGALSQQELNLSIQIFATVFHKLRQNAGLFFFFLGRINT